MTWILIFLEELYEYLLRKFAEGSGQSAGEFYTPSEVANAYGTHIRPSARGYRIRSLLRFGEGY